MCVSRGFLAFFIAFLLISCHNEPGYTGSAPQENTISKDLESSHKMYVRQESDEITQYIKRHGYTMQETSTGIYYMLYEHGKGEQARTGIFAKVNYSVWLLDGTLCYDSKHDGAKEFLIGKDAVESGVHQAVCLMRVGDKGLFIIPSYLAHGLVGDRDKIPPGATVIYDISLLSLRKKVKI